MDPHWIHGVAIIRIGKYLVDNPDYGVIYTIDKTKGIGFYVDNYFAGDWDSDDSSNADNFLSRTGLLSYMQADLSSGVANFKLRLHFILLNMSILTCLKRYVNHYQSNSW